MWDSTGFGDNTGGFFVNSNQTSSPAQGKGKGETPRRLQSVIPVCIRQIRDHPEEEFRLFGTPTQILRLVGVLKEFEVQTTKATYEIEDHTGRISAVWWLENDSNTAPVLPPVKEGCYVCIFGNLRVRDNTKMLMIIRMFPVDEINKITLHLLEVIHTRLEAEAASKGEGLAMIKANNPGAELVNSMSFMNGFEAETNSMGLTPLQERVYNILKPVTSQLGLTRDAILKHFQPRQHAQVNEALEFLILEGHAYCTFDNDHFKVTESM